MNLINLIKFDSLGDERGELVSLESMKNIPFEIKRMYYLLCTKKGVSRGFHAHHKLKQVVVAISGSCRFSLDDGVDKEDIILDNPREGLLIDSFLWREIHDFSPDCVLVVLASEVYKESDYIRDYNDFLGIINNEK